MDAARMEVAAGRGLAGDGVSPGSLMASAGLPAEVRAPPREAPGYRDGAGCPAPPRHCPLDDAPQVHHRDIVGQVFDHGEVVGDEEVGDTQGLLQGFRRLRIWAWTETSRADVGSSQMRSSGCTARARATAMR